MVNVSIAPFSSAIAASTAPAFADLDDAGRLEAFDVARRMRKLEAALDRDGLSTTARAVLDRVLRSPVG